jgi:hypothetical protein
MHILEDLKIILKALGRDASMRVEEQYVFPQNLESVLLVL